MEVVFDSDVLMILEVMQSSIPANKLIGIAEVLPHAARLLWGNCPQEPVIAASLFLRLAGDQIESSILGFHALHFPTSTGLVLLSLFDSDSLNLFIANHEGEAGSVPLGMRQHPTTTEMQDVANGALLLVSQLCTTVSTAVRPYRLAYCRESGDPPS